MVLEGPAIHIGLAGHKLTLTIVASRPGKHQKVVVFGIASITSLGRSLFLLASLF